MCAWNKNTFEIFAQEVVVTDIGISATQYRGKIKIQSRNQLAELHY